MNMVYLYIYLCLLSVFCSLILLCVCLVLGSVVDSLVHDTGRCPNSEPHTTSALRELSSFLSLSPYFTIAIANVMTYLVTFKCIEVLLVFICWFCMQRGFFGGIFEIFCMKCYCMLTQLNFFSTECLCFFCLSRTFSRLNRRYLRVNICLAPDFRGRVCDFTCWIWCYPCSCHRYPLLGHYSLRVFSQRNDTLPNAFWASVEMTI